MNWAFDLYMLIQPLLAEQLLQSPSFILLSYNIQPLQLEIALFVLPAGAQDFAFQDGFQSTSSNLETAAFGTIDCLKITIMTFIFWLRLIPWCLRKIDTEQQCENNIAGRSRWTDYHNKWWQASATAPGINMVPPAVRVEGSVEWDSDALTPLTFLPISQNQRWL